MACSLFSSSQIARLHLASARPRGDDGLFEWLNFFFQKLILSSSTGLFLFI